MNNLIEIPMNQQEVEKNYITIIFEDKESRVSWYADTSIEDARFSIICACDALVDSEFEVLDVTAKPVDMNKITHFKNGSIYFLRKKATIGKPTNILLDGRRKLFVEIEPLRHAEAQVAVRLMMIGSNLLKHTKKGFPHIRLFQLSSDLKRILWYTKSKKITESQISIGTVEDISLGQVSENFMRYPLRMLEEFSFSIYYKTNEGITTTLDLTCKDEREFDLWVIGIKALHAHFNNKIICKNDLLSHSRSYREQVDKGNIGSCSKFLFYNKTTQDSDSNAVSKNSKKSLEKFIVSRNLSQFEIAKLFLKLSLRIKSKRNDVESLSMHNDYNTGMKEQGYDMIFAEEAIVDDLDTQKNQMVELFKQCEKNLAVHLREFLWYSREHKLSSEFNVHEDDMDEFMKTLQELESHSIAQLNTLIEEDFNPEKINFEFFLKELDIQLWKIEIDLENVGDIINRFKTPHNPGMLESIKNLLTKIIN